jgi:2-polyprenyl-6-methoxyphenol hydroxylase-like FAD-dependent oxidoreductase
MMIKVPVLIAGGGPVGLALAADLNWRGIKTLLVEAREETTSYPKMDVTNSRTMEHFRRLGLAESIRAVAVDDNTAMDCLWATDMRGWLLGTKSNPSAAEHRQQILSNNDGTQPLEPCMRMPQYDLEPFLKRHLEQSENVDVRFGWAVKDFVQDDSGITTTLVSSSTGEEETVRSEFLAGCDGGNSVVRKSLGIRYEGTPSIAPLYMIHFHSKDYDVLQRFGQAWHYHLLNTNSVLIAQDDKLSWTLHTMLPPEVDATEANPVEILESCLGLGIDCEIKLAESWTPHLLVARSYGDGRVWLAGDSAHQYIPTGGYGMNTGIADAMDVSWKFSAILQGWGGEKLLSSITEERRGAGLHSRRGARAQWDERLGALMHVSPVILCDDDEGVAARREFSDILDRMQADERGNSGIALGYHYANSSIVRFEGGTPPAEDVWDYQPSTYPGCRAPHVFLENGEALFDQFGEGFTLLRLTDADCSAFEEAAERIEIPLKIVDVRDENVREIYGKELFLIRPDQHIAWRDDIAPDAPIAEAILNQVRGA